MFIKKFWCSILIANKKQNLTKIMQQFTLLTRRNFNEKKGNLRRNESKLVKIKNGIERMKKVKKVNLLKYLKKKDIN